MILWAAILASSMGFIDSSVTSIAIPAIRAALQASLPQAQWIHAAYLLALRLPEGGEVWRGVVAEAKDRPVLYRWSAGGDLVTLQPHPVLTGTETLIVYRPGP